MAVTAYHPTTRLLAMLEILQARGLVSGAELARRLETDRRSVRRYVAMLQELGIPVEAERGPHGGYRLRRGYKLPPLMFSADEAWALALGLRGLPRLGLALDGPAVEGALAKLERVLPDAVRERVRAVESMISLEARPEGGRAPGDLAALLAAAAREGRRVRLRYRAGDGAQTERDVDPYGIALWSHHWYVAGYDHLRRELRTFRLDRVLGAEPADATFEPPVGFDALGHVVRAIAVLPGAFDVEVLLGLPIGEARRRVPAAFGALEEEPAGTRFRCRFDDLDDLARFLVGLGCRLEVRRPAELRAAFGRLAAALAGVAAP